MTPDSYAVPSRGLAREVQVASLEAAPDWSDARQKELLSTNEQMERMLLALDELTGLDGEARVHKKAKIQTLNSLCARLDAVKQAQLARS